MEIKLSEKPKNPIIIEGFPGFGLVGTITTEFLVEHLGAKLIGTIEVDDVPAMVAIHDQKVVHPIGIFYDKKSNIVVLHVITSVTGVEWQIAKKLVEFALDVDAKEIISIEGVGSMNMQSQSCYYYSNDLKAQTKLKSIKLEPLKEGIILGVTGALLANIEKIKLSCIFAETHSSMPDSIAAAKVIEVLDKYLDLKLDPKPLLEQAKKFEEKIKGIMEKSQDAQEEQVKNKLRYVG